MRDEIFFNTELNRSLILRSKINEKNWTHGLQVLPTESGYYRCLNYDIDPRFLKLSILYFLKDGGYCCWCKSYTDRILLERLPRYWQELECSDL